VLLYFQNLYKIDVAYLNTVISNCVTFVSLFPTELLYLVDGLDLTLSNVMAIVGAKPHLEDPRALMKRVG